MLEGRLRELDQRARGVELGPLERGGVDVGDVLAESERRDAAMAERSRLLGELRDVGAALDRLRDHTYGACADCGAEIAPARLRAMPVARRCVACQARAEREDQKHQDNGEEDPCAES